MAAVPGHAPGKLQGKKKTNLFPCLSDLFISSVEIEVPVIFERPLYNMFEYDNTHFLHINANAKGTKVLIITRIYFQCTTESLISFRTLDSTAVFQEVYRRRIYYPEQYCRRTV